MLGPAERLKLERAETATLTTPRLLALVEQLEHALARHNWRLAETLLCVLLRANLVSVFESVCTSGLGFVALRASSAKGSPAVRTSRLARELVSELSGLAREFG